MLRQSCLFRTCVGALTAGLACGVITLPAVSEAGALEANAYVKGTVRDFDRLPIPAASIEFHCGVGHISTVTDAHGRFRLQLTCSEAGQLHIASAGFADADIAVPLATAAGKDLDVILAIEEKHEQVEVDSRTNQPLIEHGRAENTQVLGSHELAALPDDPDALRSRLQMLAAASGGGGGNAEVRVDGFLGGADLPSKSSIREIRLNPDLYAAQYDRAPIMGGLIEVATQPSLNAFHGGAFADLDSWLLDARESLAPSRASHTSTHTGANLTGPVFHKKIGFTLDFENREIGQYSVVDASLLNGAGQRQSFLQNVLAPQQLWRGLARLDWQINQQHSAFLSYAVNDSSQQNSGVGGLVLPQAGYQQGSRRDDVRISDTLTLSPSLLNEMRIGLSLVHQTIDPNSLAPHILVAGEFESGGSTAQQDNARTLNTEWSDSLSYTHRGHTLYFGAQAQHKGLSEYATNGFNGSYIFGGLPTAGLDSLQQYSAWLNAKGEVSPTALLLSSGGTHATANQWIFGAFAQDEWQINPRLTLSYGLRYEAQSYPANPSNWAPRLGIAYALDGKRHWVVRVRAGIFYSLVDSNLLLDSNLHAVGNQTQDITYYFNGQAASFATNRQLMSGIQPATSFQPQISIEHQIKSGLDVRASLSEVRAWHLARSRNINAPLSLGDAAASLFAPRPFGFDTNLDQYEASGSESGSLLYLGGNYTASRSITLFGGYMWMNLHTNADSPQTFPQSSYSNQGEWAAPSWQASQRVFAGGYLTLPGKVTSTFLFGYANGTPFNITTGLDNNGDGVFNDRPFLTSPTAPGAYLTPYGALAATGSALALARNAGLSPGTLTLDTSLSRSFALGHAANESVRSLALSIRATNLLNHLNPAVMNGVLGSNSFGLPVTAEQSRHFEANLRFSF